MILGLLRCLAGSTSSSWRFTVMFSFNLSFLLLFLAICCHIWSCCFKRHYMQILHWVQPPTGSQTLLLLVLTTLQSALLILNCILSFPCDWLHALIVSRSSCKSEVLLNILNFKNLKEIWLLVLYVQRALRITNAEHKRAKKVTRQIGGVVTGFRKEESRENKDLTPILCALRCFACCEGNLVSQRTESEDKQQHHSASFYIKSNTITIWHVHVEQKDLLLLCNLHLRRDKRHQT